MGSEMTCICSTSPQNDSELNNFNLYGPSGKRSVELFRSFTENQEFVYSNENIKIVILDDISLEKYLKIRKNLIVPSKNPIQVNELASFYNDLKLTNYKSNKGEILALMSFHKCRYEKQESFRKALNLSTFEFKFEDLKFISKNKSKSLEFLEFTLNINLKKNYSLCSVMTNYFENRCARLIFKRIADKELNYKQYKIVPLENLNLESIQQILNENCQKKLVGVYFDFFEENSLENCYYFIFQTNRKMFIVEYLYHIHEFELGIDKHSACANIVQIIQNFRINVG